MVLRVAPPPPPPRPEPGPGPGAGSGGLRGSEVRGDRPQCDGTQEGVHICDWVGGWWVVFEKKPVLAVCILLGVLRQDLRPVCNEVHGLQRRADGRTTIGP